MSCESNCPEGLIITLFQGPPGVPGTGGGGGGGNWYYSHFTGNGIVRAFFPIQGFSTTDAARYQVVIDGVTQEPNFSFDIVDENGGTVLFPVPIYSGARISVITQNT
jgi:hypothetical protein